MNVAASDSRTASRLVDRPAARVASTATTTHAVLIPSYNSGARLFETVAIVRRQGWPVWVVIDGSTDGTGERLARESQNDPDLHVCLLPHNQGKGAAVLHGLKRADAQGVTHAVTVDADGQHSSDHIKALVALSRVHPDAIVLGVPIFDSSAQAIRVAGHRVSKVLADLVTLRSGIGNPLFGFRVYPVAALLRVFEETSWMRRFDFDSEAVIRLSWQGIPAINVATPVRYFRRADGGVSHFHYVRDNLLLLAMYVRLSAALVPRLPKLMMQRIRSFRRRLG